MAKDYYLLLGVPLDAAPAEIRSAFRKLALRYHPDRRGGSRPGRFQDISEAYDVLSDPARRARYDRGLRRRRLAVVPASSRVQDPEPLISNPVPLAGQPETTRPSYEALLDRLARNFSSLDLPKAEREEPLEFELILSHREAERGILVPFDIPVFSICFRCGGVGRDGLFPCDECDGEGRAVDRDAIDVRVPGGIRDGAVIEISLEELGVHNLWLRLHVRVQAH